MCDMSVINFHDYIPLTWEFPKYSLSRFPTLSNEIKFMQKLLDAEVSLDGMKWECKKYFSMSSFNLLDVAIESQFLKCKQKIDELLFCTTNLGIAIIACTTIIEDSPETLRRRLDNLITSSNFNINATSSCGYTALRLACINGNKVAVRWLLDHDCNIDRSAYDISSYLMCITADYSKFNDMTAIFVNHCDKLTALGRTYSEHYHRLFERYRPKVQKQRSIFIEECAAELDEMKMTVSADLSITYRDILEQGSKSATACVRRLGFAYFQKKKLHTRLPIYGNIIICKLKLAYNRVTLVNKFKDECLEKFGFHVLPELCVDRIIQCLSNNDMKTVVDAFTVSSRYKNYIFS